MVATTQQQLLLKTISMNNTISTTAITQCTINNITSTIHYHYYHDRREKITQIVNINSNYNNNNHNYQGWSTTTTMSNTTLTSTFIDFNNYNIFYYSSKKSIFFLHFNGCVYFLPKTNWLRWIQSIYLLNFHCICFMRRLQVLVIVALSNTKFHKISI